MPPAGFYLRLGPYPNVRQAAGVNSQIVLEVLRRLLDNAPTMDANLNASLKDTVFTVQINNKRPMRRRRSCENPKEVLDREQILASAPSLWEVLTEGITDEANDLNEMRPGLASIKDQIQGNSPSLSVSITSAAMARRTLHLAFNPNIPKITYNIFQPQGPTQKALQITEGEFTFRVIRESVWLYGRDEEIAVEDAVNCS